MMSVSIWHADLSIGSSQGVEYSNIKLNLPPQTPFATISSLAPSWEFAEAPVRPKLMVDNKICFVWALQMLTDAKYAFSVNSNS